MKANPFKVALVGFEGHSVPKWVRQELADAGIEFVAHECQSEQEFQEYGGDADLVWVFGGNRIKAEVLRLFPRCGAIIRSGSGTDNIPVAAATERGIIVANTPEALADPVSNHAIGLLLAVVHRIAIQDRAVRQGRWEQQRAEHRWHLRGQTMGLVGFGHIGRLVARKLIAFEMKILAFDPLVRAEEMAETSVEAAPFEDVLSRSDFISIHCPLTPKTRHLIGEPQFRSMKPNVVFINTSRGPVVDEQALVAALEQGQIAAAGLDVTEQEPTPPDNPLLKLDNVVITPHIAGYTDQFAESFWRHSVKAIYALANHRWPPSYVNRDVEPRWEMS